jgi:hypothetical protein
MSEAIDPSCVGSSVTGIVLVPHRIVSLANHRGHWRARAAAVKQARRATALSLAQFGAWRPSRPCVVTMTRIAPRRLDDDNLAGACKPVRDEIAAWAGWPSDALEDVTWVCKQTFGLPRQYAVVIEIRRTTT